MRRYDCDLAQLNPDLARLFLRLEEDDAARAFLSQAPHGKLQTLAHDLFGHVLSDYDTNALLGCFPMHLLSVTQWRALLDGHETTRLLDIGAGSGDVLSALAPLFREVVTTETSRGMSRKLRARGYTCHRVDLAEESLPGGATETFDVVSLLHVIDRAKRPLTLLERATARVERGGLLIVAVPLPLSTHVHVAGGTVDAEEVLPPCGARTWEPAVCSLVTRVIRPLGVTVERVARAPYLSRGDARAPSYALDDAIVVARR